VYFNDNMKTPKHIPINQWNAVCSICAPRCMFWHVSCLNVLIDHRRSLQLTSWPIDLVPVT